MDKTLSQMELTKSGSKEYKVKVICNSKIYTKKSNSSHLPELYYLFF